MTTETVGEAVVAPAVAPAAGAEAKPAPAPAPAAPAADAVLDEAFEAEAETGAEAPAEDDAAGGDEQAAEPAEGEEAGDGSPVPSDAKARAEWVPEKAEDYGMPVVEGVTWNDEAAANIKDFFAVAHELDLSQGAVDKLAGWLTKRTAEIQSGWKARDVADTKATRAALTKELGESNYKPTINALAATLSGLGDLGAQIKAARLPDGSRLVNRPEFVRLMAEVGALRHPSIDRRLAEIDRVMNQDIHSYRQSGMSEERRELLARKEKNAGARASAVPAQADRIAELGRIRDTDIQRFRNERNGEGMTLAAEMLALQRQK